MNSMERCRVEIAKTSYMYSKIRDYSMEEDFDDEPIEGIPAPLTWPLKEISIAFHREEEFYSGTVQIVPSKGTDFQDYLTGFIEMLQMEFGDLLVVTERGILSKKENQYLVL